MYAPNARGGEERRCVWIQVLLFYLCSIENSKNCICSKCSCFLYYFGIYFTPEGCAAILRGLLETAVDVKKFEPYPHAYFMRKGGIFELRFAVVKGPDGNTIGRNAAAAAAGAAAAGEQPPADQGKRLDGVNKRDRSRKRRNDQRGHGSPRAAVDAGSPKAADAMPGPKDRAGIGPSFCFRHAASVIGVAGIGCQHKSCKFEHPTAITKEQREEMERRLAGFGNNAADWQMDLLAKLRKQ